MKEEHKKQQNVLIGIIIVVVIVTISYFLNSQEKATNNNSEKTATKETLLTELAEEKSNDQTQLSYDGLIFYLLKDENNNIYSQKSKADKKLLFTDKNEEEKVKSLGGITDQGEILAVFAPNNQDFGGSLKLISTDGSGKSKKIIGEFASPESPQISPDGRLIAYILFSNTEIDYGFSAYVMSVSGQNKVKIDSDSSLLSGIAWSPDSQRISYVKGAGNNLKLYLADADGQNQKELYSIPGNYVTTNICWNKGNLLVVLNAISSGDSEILSIDPQTNKVKTFLKTSNYIAGVSWAGDDKIFYLSGEKGGDISYKLNLVDQNNNSSNIGSANSIIGWTK